MFFFTCFLYFLIIIFYRLLILASAPPPPPPLLPRLQLPSRADARFCLPLFFHYDYYYTGKLPPPRSNYRHEQTHAFVWDHCKESGRIITRRLLFCFVYTILNIRKCRHGNASIYHWALRNDYVCPFHALLIPEDVLPGESKAIGIIGAL